MHSDADQDGREVDDGCEDVEGAEESEDPTGEDSLRLWIGNVSAYTNIQELELPIVPSLMVRSRIADALDHVVATRKGALVLGPKGIGKSFALAQELLAFRKAEAEKSVLNDGYERQTVVHLPALSSRSYHEGLIYLCQQVIGPSFQPSARGKQKKDDALLAELTTTCLAQNVVALAVDETERCTREGLRLLRDVMADAEAYALAGRAGGPMRALGVGVLLVGTNAVRPLIERSGEAKQRWTMIVDARRHPRRLAPLILAGWFPSFAAHAASIGHDAWTDFIRRVIPPDRTAMRHLGLLAVEYFRLMVRHRQTNTKQAFTRETVPWDQKMFEYAIQRLNGGASGPSGSASGVPA